LDGSLLMKRILACIAAAAVLSGPAFGKDKPSPGPKTPTEILAASPAEDWRPLDLSRTLIMTLPQNRQVVIELAPAFAPKATDNVLALVRQGYFDGLAILRVQDNYVTQWGDPNAGEPTARLIAPAARTLPPEWTRPLKGLPFTELKDGDVYAKKVGWVDGMPVASDGKQEAWLAHCYGMVGVGRDVADDSGPGSELYAVIGHSPRHLDRNIALIGRVVKGIEHLASLPRGTGPLGFYEKPEQMTPIVSVRIAGQLKGGGPAGVIEMLRTDSPTFARLVESRRNRDDGWTKVKAGKIEVCNGLLPIRPKL
jgi:peptidylprolyl isomerase